VEIREISESSITAGVNVTLPVIAQGWFCSSFPEGSQSGSGKLGETDRKVRKRRADRFRMSKAQGRAAEVPQT
jgi:hypothetical protein